MPSCRPFVSSTTASAGPAAGSGASIASRSDTYSNRTGAVFVPVFSGHSGPRHFLSLEGIRSIRLVCVVDPPVLMSTLASSRLSKRQALSSSSRSHPLNDSIQAFCHGEQGSMKTELKSFERHHFISASESACDSSRKRGCFKEWPLNRATRPTGHRVCVQNAGPSGRCHSSRGQAAAASFSDGWTNRHSAHGLLPYSACLQTCQLRQASRSHSDTEQCRGSQLELPHRPTPYLPLCSSAESSSPMC